MPGIKHGTPPDQLSISQRAQFYRAYFNAAIDKKAGGAAALGRLNDSEAASALADTLFRHGAKGGAQLIQDAINDFMPKKQKIDRDGAVGRKTIEEFSKLVKSNARQRFLDVLAAWRTKAMPGEAARFDHFRFQKSP